MLFFIISISVLGIIFFTVTYLRNREEKGRGEAPAYKHKSPDDGCCGLHEVCERDKMLASGGKKIDYYDDEELDRFQGLASDAYPDEAVEEFREVLYTLRETEVADWLRSLQLRNISLPDSLKDEAILIVSEQRM